MNGIERIAAERKRQIEVEGWSLERDSELYPAGELVLAAMAYSTPSWMRDGHKWLVATNWTPQQQTQLPLAFWPWDKEWWKPSPDDRIRELEKAGALIAAEIDRLLARRRPTRMAIQPDPTVGVRNPTS